MAQQTINIGASPNDGTGTPLRTAFQYTNSNFSELYTAVGPSGNNIVVPGSATITGDLTVNGANGITVTNGKFATNASGQTVGLQLDSFVSGGAFNNYILNNASAAGTVSALNFGRLTSLLFGFIRTNNNSQNLQLGTTGAGSVEFFQNNSTAMTLNATGLGVGGSPSYNLDVRGASSPTIQVRNTTSGIGNFAQLRLDVNNSFSGSGTAYLRAISGNTGNSNVDLAFGVNAAGGGAPFEAMRIDSSGNVGIGVTPSAWGGSYKALQLLNVARSIAATGAGSGDLTVAFNAIYDSTDSRWEYAGTGDKAGRYSQTGSGNHRWFVSNTAGTAGNEITDFASAAMTLDASGNLLVGKTTLGDSNVGCQFMPTAGLSVSLTSQINTQTTLAVYSTGASAYRFYVGMGGTVYATNTTISAISDQRLKENVQDIDVGLGAILALKPRKFDWKEGKGKNIKGDRGFIAQEFEQVFPQLVDEWKDEAPEGEAPYKSVRQDLIPVLVKAIQELTARVQTLETR